MTDWSSTLPSVLAPRYRDLALLAEGGMGTVFSAHDSKLNRDVAIKVLPPEVGSAIPASRFREEIRIAARLQHPHIVPLFESGEADGHLYYVMPLVSGESVKDRLDREGPFPLPEALEVSGEIASALAYAHAEGVVHRDVKPANVLLTPAGAMILDFGVARAMEEAGGTDLTRTGISIGTPTYMSPEQSSGDRNLDGRSDQYSLACVVYEMLAGEPPFSGASARLVMAKHFRERPPTLEAARPDLPPMVGDAIAVALAKAPADRFKTVLDFQKALSGEVPVPPRTAGLKTPTQRPRAIRLPTLGIVGFALAVLGYWIWSIVSGLQLDPNRIVVFPLEDSAAPLASDGIGADLVTYIGYVLEGTDPLQWVEGREVLPGNHDSESLSHRAAQRYARRAEAGFFINGSVLRGRDSATVVLRLYDSRSGELVQRAGRGGPVSEGSEFGLAAGAAVELISGIIEPGRPIDVAALSLRNPAALTHFHLGEVANLSAHFREAVGHYELALRQDSSFALAAVRAAQAASWIEEAAAALRFSQLATQQDSLLPPKYRHFAWGIFHYQNAEADSAIGHLQQALDLDQNWSEAHAALAEVYYHRVLDGTRADSLATAGFREARRLDPSFRLPAYHLAEMAVRRGDLEEAEELIGTFSQTHPDSVLRLQLDLMLACARTGPASVEWNAIAGRDAVSLEGVRDAAQALSAGGQHLGCAEAGARAALVASDSASDRWGAFLLLHNILLAQGRISDLFSLMDSESVSGLPARRLLLMDITVDSTLREGAEAEARLLIERGLEANSPTNLWLLGQWAWAEGEADLLQEICLVLGLDADASGLARDRHILGIMEARLAELRGDLDHFGTRTRALTPKGTLQSLLWDPWEAAAGERVDLARLHLEHGEYREALALASEMDSHRAVVNLIYLPESLEIRIDAAEGLGDPDAATVFRTRLNQLRGTDGVPGSSPQGEGGQE